jgi:2-oxoglutarate dehydrogenase E2 component (dihydrolipoamide succinyltransferase)
MSVEIKVPVLPESISEATIAAWHKQVGETIRRDENLVDLETDKVVLEVPSPVNGVVRELLFNEGDTVEDQQLLARIDEGEVIEEVTGSDAGGESSEETPVSIARSSPAVRKMMAENDIDPDVVTGSGKDGRITKIDVQAVIDGREKSESTKVEASRPDDEQAPVGVRPVGERNDRREPMSRLRATIAQRLKEAQNTQAMLTTFNDVNLQAVLDLRKQYREAFEERYGVRLGMMSFFVKASLEALKRYPAVNASIDGSDLVYHDYYDVGIAASSPRGLVVPVLRDVDEMGFSQVEKSIVDYAMRARDGSLTMDDLAGGTFTITNGGVFGSLLSTPIINPPQSAILGMHRIEQRPVAENGEVIIRPMMYLALTYDHRIIDGAEAVQFLVTIKESLEDPARMLIEI